MKYKKFIIHNYRAISDNLVIDIENNRLLPIIGINESGKTSILYAIFSFDYYNDSLNNGRHLENVVNLYETSETATAAVSAEIEISKDEIIELLNEIKAPDNRRNITKLIKALEITGLDEIRITRDLISRKYSLSNKAFTQVPILSNTLARTILTKLPYILYFDDFRDSVEEEMEIVGENGIATGWLAILEQLFKKTNKSYSVFKLKGEQELRRTSILSDVQEVLNTTLTKEWEKFTLEKGGSKLEVIIEYKEKEDRPFLRLKVKERINNRDRFFGIRDRSKGFYWFFNFVTKLEFNPKVRGSSETETIYLLDEPGSYLHSTAQTELCKKLNSLSGDNTVIYSTHTHYLLDPEIIPINTINIASKNKKARVVITPLHSYDNEERTKRNALQPIFDALRIKPFILDMNYKKVCITEGLTDYYLLEMLNKDKSLKFLPSVDAHSVLYFISLCIFWGVNYCAIWDNDTEGRTEKMKAEKHYGESESGRLLLYPKIGKGTDTILQDLFSGNDLQKVRKILKIPENTSFKKTIMTWYYEGKGLKIFEKLSKKTQQNLEETMKLIGAGLSK